MHAADIDSGHDAGLRPAAAGDDGIIDLRGRLRPATGRLKLPALAEGPFVHVYTDRITKAVRQAITHGYGADWKPAEKPDVSEVCPDPATLFYWWFPFREESKGDILTGIVGLPRDCDPELLMVLKKNPALVMQTELILSARVYQQCGFDAESLARLSVPAILDDREISRLQSGGHKRARLEEQRLALRFVTSLTLVGSYWSLGRSKPAALNGEVWRVPDDDRALLWSPRSRSAVFTVGRGALFGNWAWEHSNQFAKPIGAGLLRLMQKRKTAVLLGAYLATLAPMNGFRPKPLDLGTLVKEAGLAQGYDKDPKRQRERLEQALDVLRAEGVIGPWDYWGTERAQVRIRWALKTPSLTSGSSRLIPPPSRRETGRKTPSLTSGIYA